MNENSADSTKWSSISRNESRFQNFNTNVDKNTNKNKTERQSVTLRNTDHSISINQSREMNSINLNSSLSEQYVCIFYVH